MRPGAGSHETIARSAGDQQPRTGPGRSELAAEPAEVQAAAPPGGMARLRRGPARRRLDRPRRSRQRFPGRAGRRAGDRRPERDRAALAGRAAPALHGAHRPAADPDRRRADAARRRPHHRPRPADQLLLVGARGGLRGGGGDGRARRRPGHERRRRLHAAGDPANCQALGRPYGHRRAGDPLSRDRRARPARVAARVAGRQRADDGPLGRGGHAPARRVGDRPLLPDRSEPGRDPARLERRHSRLPLGREGDGEAGRLLGAARLRRDRAAARVRARPAHRWRRQPREPALGRGRQGDPDRQPHGCREAREPGLPGLLRQRLHRRHDARALLLGDRRSSGPRPAGRSGATSGLAATGAGSTRSCERRSASSSAT